MDSRKVPYFIFTVMLHALVFSGQALAGVVLKPGGYIIQMSNSKLTVLLRA